MATFEQRVEGMTGLDIDGSSTPTQNELTEFLKDGVIEVTQRVLAIRPMEASEYMRATTGVANDTVDVKGAKIVNVLRESGTSGDWRECRQINAGDQARVTDPDSLSYATKYHPAFLINDDQHINVYPSPGSSDDGMKVYYVNHIPTASDAAPLDYSKDGIKYFPNDKDYLVVLYASIKSLEVKLAELTLDEEDVELAGSLVANISLLKGQYEGDIASLDPAKAKVQRGEKGRE